MERDLKFISKNQRMALNDALNIVKVVYEDITLEHEEYLLLRSIIGDLKKAISYQDNYY